MVSCGMLLAPVNHVCVTLCCFDAKATLVSGLKYLLMHDFIFITKTVNAHALYPCVVCKNIFLIAWF